MLKPEILDPQGQALARSLPRLGFGGVTNVRQGKRFEIEFSEVGEHPDGAQPADGAGEDGADGDTNEFPELADLRERSRPARFSEESLPAHRTEADVLAEARRIAETLLANPVIEDFEVRVLR